MLTIDKLRYTIGDRTLFDEASARVHAGHKVGLVGPNGSGKSTLLRMIVGAQAPDGGEIRVRRGARVGTVSQEAPGGETTPLQFVLDADTERTRLLAEAETATDPHRIADIHTRLVEIGAAAAPARAATILAGLGFDEAAQSRPLESFSGGWRMRVALAATLFSATDLLLLDEPSNHLDLESRIWLEGYLRSHPGTIVLVSHDRTLLNAIVDTVVHLEDARLVTYRGDYDAFERTRAERRVHRAAEYAKQEAQRAHVQAFIDRFRAKATKARQVQSRLKALERMETIAPIRPDREVSIDLPDPEPIAPPLFRVEAGEAGYGRRAVILQGLDFRIDPDDRIALLGANGNGKTTLLKLLAGELAPLGGTVWRAPKLRVGYFAQDQAEAFDPAKTAYQHMAALMAGAPEPKVRAHLGRFGLAQERGDTPIGSLSGGEKAKLLIASITRAAPHLLLLDEPTNHLDIETREALVMALGTFGGAVILVSHDPTLVEATANRLWLVAGGAVKPFDGDLDDYRALCLEQRRAERREGRAEEAERATRKDARRAAAEARAALAPLRRAVEAAEKRLETATAERDAVRAELADPTLYEGPSERIAEAQRRLAAVEGAVAEAEADWLAAQEKLEGAET